MRKEKHLIDIRDTLSTVDTYSCDIETVDLSRDTRITAIIFACRPAGKEDVGWVLYTRDYPTDMVAKILSPIFDDTDKICVFYNANFDVPRLHRHKIYIKNRIADAMLMVWLHNEDRIRHGGYGLKYCVKKYLNHTMAHYEEAQSLFGDFTKYALEDALYTLKLYYYLYEILFSKSPKLEKWFWDYEMPTQSVLIQSEMRGSCLDPSQLKIVQAHCLSKLDRLENEIYTAVGHRFDISSNKQCAKVLFGTSKSVEAFKSTNKSKSDLSGFFTEDSSLIDESLAEKFSSRGKSGEYSTSKSVLKAMSYEGNKIASLILDFREISTRLNTFVRPSLNRCKRSNIIHPKFFQTTKSGRLRSRDPNYQNLPRTGGIRKSFVARPSYKIVKADYSQAELRLIASLSNDPVMISIYKNNGDIHQRTAEACQISRQEAKAVNFLLIYRGSANRLQAELAKEGVAISKIDASRYIKRYFSTYKKVRDYHRSVERVVMGRLDTYMDNNPNADRDSIASYIMTLAKRKRRFTIKELSGERQYGSITQAINTTVQGGVGDLVKVAMVDCQKRFVENGWLDIYGEDQTWDAYIHGQVHDEIFTECREEISDEVASILTECMENAGRKYNLKVPMPADAEIRDNLAK